MKYSAKNVWWCHHLTRVLIDDATLSLRSFSHNDNCIILVSPFVTFPSTRSQNCRIFSFHCNSCACASTSPNLLKSSKICCDLVICVYFCGHLQHILQSLNTSILLAHVEICLACLKCWYILPSSMSC